MVILEVCDLTKRFGALTAVQDVTLSLEDGEILGMIGPNGAGKTTIFNIIAGVYRPSRGRVIFAGRNITGLKPYRICRLGVAKTSQIVEPFRAMTVFENVQVAALYGAALSMAESRRRSAEVLEFVGLSGQQDKAAASISVPQRRRLELARALASGPRVLLLDETMAGLNPHEIDEALGLLRKIRDSGKSLVVVEHIMRAVMGISDRVLVLNYGEKIAEGSPQEVASNEQVVEAYLGKKELSLGAGR
jgi:branched-chain amino acid transport system ATP-binding protein